MSGIQEGTMLQEGTMPAICSQAGVPASRSQE